MTFQDILIVNRLEITRISHPLSMSGSLETDGNKRMNARPQLTPLDLEQNNPISIGISGSSSNNIIKSYQPIKTPRSEMSESLPLTHSVSSTIFELNQILIFDVTPELKSIAPGEEYNKLFINKCKQCSQICDFTFEGQVEEKHAKDLILEDILQSVSNTNIIRTFGVPEYEALYDCFSKNVIRTTPEPPEVWFAPCCIDFQLDKVEELGWSHLSMMYDILYAFVTNPRYDSHKCKNITPNIFKSIIFMFQSPDNREREKLMKLLHAFYKVFRSERTEARQNMSSFLKHFITSDTPFLGVSELLTTMVSIIAGYKTPLHSEHIEFFKDALLPLHKSPHLQLFHTSMVTAVNTMLDKDPRLAPLVFDIIFEHWPKTSPTKQILLLRELEVLVNFVILDPNPQLAVRLANLIAKCVNDAHFAVAERAMMIWESDSFLQIISQNAELTYPILLPRLYMTNYSHWCYDVRELALSTMKVLKGCNSLEFEQVGVNLKQLESSRIMSEYEKGSLWNQLVLSFERNEEKKKKLQYIISHSYIGCESIVKSSH